MISRVLTSPLDRRLFIRRAAIGAAGFAGIVQTSSPAVAAEAVTVALDWYPNANHAGLFVAREQGAFTAAGIEIDLYTPSDPTVVLQTVGAGRDTFGISYQTDVLLARAQRVPVVSIAALVQRPLVCMMSLKTAGITRPADLVGKTIGYPGIPSQEAFLATMLESDGLTLEDISLVNVEFNLLPALISGQATAVMGAYWTHETIIAEREGYPVDILRVEDWGVPEFYELVIVASEKTVKDKSDLVSAFLSVLRKGYEEAIADPELAVDILEAAYPETDRAVEEEGLDLLIPAWTEGVSAFGVQTPERWASYAGWMKERGLIPADLDVEAAYDANLIPSIPATPVART